MPISPVGSLVLRSQALAKEYAPDVRPHHSIPVQPFSIFSKAITASRVWLSKTPSTARRGSS